MDKAAGWVLGVASGDWTVGAGDGGRQASTDTKAPDKMQAVLWGGGGCATPVVSVPCVWPAMASSDGAGGSECASEGGGGNEARARRWP